MTPTLLRLGQNCFVIRMPPSSWFYSYETLVAYSNTTTGECWRHPGPLSPASTLHLQTLGVEHYPLADSAWALRHMGSFFPLTRVTLLTQLAEHLHWLNARMEEFVEEESSIEERLRQTTARLSEELDNLLRGKVGLERAV